MSRLVQVLTGIGVLLTGGGVVMIVVSGGSGEGLSIFFLLGIFAVFIIYAVALFRWQRRHWANAAHRYEVEGRMDTQQGWEQLEQQLTESPLHPLLTYFASTLLRRQRGGEMELFRTQEAQAAIHFESPYIPAESRLPGWLGTGQAVLVTLGLMGTFLGMTIGLFEAIPLLAGATPNPDAAMNLLLGGARLAFTKSVAGMYWSIVWLFMFREAEQAYQEAFAALGSAIDRQIPRSSPEALLLYLTEERLVNLEKAILSASGRSSSTSAGGPVTDLEPVVQLLQSIDGQLQQRSAPTASPTAAMEAAADRLSIAASRLGELGNQLPSLLQPRPVAAAPAPAAPESETLRAVQVNLQELNRITQEFRASGEGLTRSLNDANVAAMSALRPLQEMSGTLHRAQVALSSQQEGMEQLKQGLRAEHQAIEGLLKQCESLTGGVQVQLRSQVEQMDQSIQRIERAYQAAQEQSLSNMNAWQQQLLEFLPEMEKRLHFPGYVKEMEQALSLEAESRKDLVEVLRRLGAAR